MLTSSSTSMPEYQVRQNTRLDVGCQLCVLSRCSKHIIVEDVENWLNGGDGYMLLSQKCIRELKKWSNGKVDRLHSLDILPCGYMVCAFLSLLRTCRIAV